MKKTVLITTAVILHASAVLAADWKFYTLYEKDKDNGMIVFYDKETIRVKKGVVQVWTKDISDHELVQVLDQNEKELRKIFDNLNEKNYIPPYAKENKLPKDERILITAYEVAANSNYASASNSTLYEINCKERKSRRLSDISYDRNGLVQTSSTPTEWFYIPPETGSETIMKLVCQKVSTK